MQTNPVGPAVIIEQSDGTFRAVSSTGQPLGYLVEHIPDADCSAADRSSALRRGASLFALPVLVIAIALALWHAGRFYEREYGIDIHQSRWSR